MLASGGRNGSNGCFSTGFTGAGFSDTKIGKTVYFYLVSTNHLEDRIWFKNDEDFKVGMDFVAIQAASDPDVKVLAFILMSK